MKNASWQFYFRLLLIVVMAGIGWFYYDKLPQSIPIHWNWKGEIDGYGSKDLHVWMFPLIIIVMMILFWFLPKLDPKKDKYEKFADVWEILQTVMVMFFVYVYFISLYAGLHQGLDVSSWVMGGMGVLFILMGNYLGKVRQNYFIGIKVPWTLNNEEVWNKTHRVGGWCFVVAGIMMLINAFVKFSVGWIFGLAMAIVLVLPILYSYVIYKRIEK